MEELWQRFGIWNSYHYMTLFSVSVSVLCYAVCYMFFVHCISHITVKCHTPRRYSHRQPTLMRFWQKLNGPFTDILDEIFAVRHSADFDPDSSMENIYNGKAWPMANMTILLNTDRMKWKTFSWLKIWFSDKIICCVWAQCFAVGQNFRISLWSADNNSNAFIQWWFKRELRFYIAHYLFSVLTRSFSMDRRNKF